MRIFVDEEIKTRKMKQKFLTMFAAAMLLLGMSACTNESDNPSVPSQQEMEESLIGLWYEEFDYEDVTESGKPFNRALIAVEAKADHTGYIALAVFDDTFNEPLEIYGGPKDAPFLWQVTAEGQVILTDPATGTTYAPSRTRGDNSHNDFVNIGQIQMKSGSGSVAFSNATHHGTLNKARSSNSGLIQDWMAKSTLPRPCITDSIPVLLFPNHMNYVFNYPSVDPFGKPCTLSGTITVNKSLIKDNEPFHGILLYNHFTIYETTQAPSFKVKKNNDFVIAGYSEGGQTTMGVLREISQRHPEIKVTRAFAGDGPYDINSMFNTVTNGETEMPSTVCNLLYAYNHFFSLGYDIHDYLKDPVAKNFDDWFLSKQYKRRPLDEELIKTKKTSDLLTDAFLNASNPLSRRFSAAFSVDALTSGWTPRSDFDIMLFHDTKDDVVPVDNFYAMSKFLKANGIKPEEFVGEYSSETTKEAGITNHEVSALTFFLRIIEWMRANY